MPVTYGPYVPTSLTSYAIPTADTLSYALVQNMSDYNLDISYGVYSQNTAIIPARQSKLLLIKGTLFNPKILSATVTTTTPGILQQLFFEILSSTEASSLGQNIAPTALQAGTQNIMSVSTLLNDGNPPNTQFVESTVLTHAQSAVTLTNNGTLTLGNSSTENGNIYLVGSSSTLSVDGIASFGSSAVVINSGQVQLASLAFSGIGSLSRISHFSGSCINGKVTVNHGLGAVPNFIIVVFNLSGTPIAATIGYNNSTLTSTSVDIWASIAANFVGLAIAF